MGLPRGGDGGGSRSSDEELGASPLPPLQLPSLPRLVDYDDDEEEDDLLAGRTLMLLLRGWVVCDWGNVCGCVVAPMFCDACVAGYMYMYIYMVFHTRFHHNPHRIRTFPTFPPYTGNTKHPPPNRPSSPSAVKRPRTQEGANGLAQGGGTKGVKIALSLKTSGTLFGRGGGG